jgi:hypothetical protein
MPQGMAWHGKAWQGMARHGKAWQGMARHGKAWQGMARERPSGNSSVAFRMIYRKSRGASGLAWPFSKRAYVRFTPKSGHVRCN